MPAFIQQSPREPHLNMAATSSRAALQLARFARKSPSNGTITFKGKVSVKTFEKIKIR
jgi:hypothetical protein